MIQLEHLSKTFPGKDSVHALRDVSLTVRKGEIYGVIGYSGAGKSTLIRCINLLERPDEGTVRVDGVELTALGACALNRERRKIGMIFQQFNLFATRTVLDNLAYPLRFSGMSRRDIREKAESLLRYVELEDKRDAYPSQLSGGQKQRVAIARALACDPKVLLCDEATSALDPQTTASILQLIQRLNREMGITVVMITHQMQVVKEACHRVAVMENGRVVEEGDVFSIFAHPQQEITRSFVDSTTNLNKVEDLLEEGAEITRLKPGEKLVRLSYQRGSAAEAIVSTVSRNFGVDVNIMLGSLELIDGALLGGLVVVFSGQAAGIENALAYFREKNVGVEVIAHADPA